MIFLESQPISSWKMWRFMCPLVRFWRTFLLQRLLKNFLEVWDACSGYLKGAPNLELSNASTLVIVRPRNHFLLLKVFIPPLNAGFGNRFFKCPVCLDWNRKLAHNEKHWFWRKIIGLLLWEIIKFDGFQKNIEWWKAMYLWCRNFPQFFSKNPTFFWNLYSGKREFTQKTYFFVIY